MIEKYILGIIGVLVVSLISLIGIFFLSLKEDILKKNINFLISLAIGALLGDAFIHLIPEIVKNGANENITSLMIIGGILTFFVIEKFIHWHHHGEEGEQEENHIHPVGKLVLFTDGFHNLIDGVIIGATFLVSIPLGIATTLAVIVHEIPQEVGDFAVLIHSGYSNKKALLYNFISALAAVLGTIIVFIFGSSIQNSIIWFLPIATGGFIYISMSDLIPELHKTKELKHSLLQFLAIILGVGLMLLLLLIE